MESFNIRLSMALCVVACLALSVPHRVAAQVCSLPALPDATITTTQDRDHMLCQLGITLPTLPPRASDPNRPVNASPVDPNNTEGNWTDPRGHVVIRTDFGLWHTYDSDSGVNGGALSGFGDYGPFSQPRYTDLDLLKAQDGWRTKTSQDWWLRRRPEIFRLIQQDLYGTAIDAHIPVNWVVSAETTGSR